jgi:hypothetical protein
MTLLIIGMVSALIVGVSIGVVLGCALTVANAFEDRCGEIQKMLDECNSDPKPRNTE